MMKLIQLYLKSSLVLRIFIGIVLGSLIALVSAPLAANTAILGALFVGALKAVAPILVFVLVLASISSHEHHHESNMAPIVQLYLLGTVAAALVALGLSTLFPVSLELSSQDTDIRPPEGVIEVLRVLLFKLVQNPVQALLEANYVGILAWAIGLGLLLRRAEATTKRMLHDVADAVTGLVKVIIELAPFGIFGLVASTIAATGFNALRDYSQLLLLLISAMLIMALIVNPTLVYFKTRSNPYPLVLRCLRESGVTAFFTRSSAANIPVNMQLCEKLDLDEDTYSVSIPLGATINMGGAAITITTMTMAAVHTLGIDISLGSALLLCVVASVSACGASGVAGGSLLLIPLACSLFGISNDIAMQVVAVGFIIGVVQDSAETALNSSTDVIYTAAACRAAEINTTKALASDA